MNNNNFPVDCPLCKTKGSLYLYTDEEEVGWCHNREYDHLYCVSCAFDVRAPKFDLWDVYNTIICGARD